MCFLKSFFFLTFFPIYLQNKKTNKYKQIRFDSANNGVLNEVEFVAGWTAVIKDKNGRRITERIRNLVVEICS